ncbi:MAG: NADH-quinone oxidoreductase subunit M [Synechococcaceae cyanobacterium]|nr:NADH-quinone oxidoreductase subunit M [Synechococcaceae cyanobacterium]
MPSITLLLLLLLPAAAALLLPLLNAWTARRLAWLSACACLGQLLLALLCWRLPPADLELRWIPKLGLELQLGLDGLSLPLVVLTALISAIAILFTAGDQPRPRLFFCLLLATNLGVSGAFLARNALLFLLAFELVLIPTTLLVAIWGGERRAGAAIRFLIYGAVSGLSLLGAVLAFGLLNTHGQGFSFASLARADYPANAQPWLLLLVLLAFGLKMPFVPLHGWQPFTYSQAPIPVVMLLAGASSKLGAYGLMRFGIGFLPEAWSSWSPWIAAIGALTAIYGALNAIAQLEMRRLAAYSSLANMGIVLMSLATASAMSLQGAVALLLSHGLIIALLFACVGLVERRTGTASISELSGLMNPLRGLPFTMGLLLLALMAAAGIPGLAAFPAELLVFEGSWTTFPIPTLLCLVSSGLTAVYAIRLFNRVGFGRLDNDKADWQATSWPERAPAVALGLLVILLGIWPTGLVGWSEAISNDLALRSLPFSSELAVAGPIQLARGTSSSGEALALADPASPALG